MQGYISGFKKLKVLLPKITLTHFTLKHLYTNKGITLIELVVIIVVVGVAIPPLMLAWQNLSYRSARAEAMSQGTFYAQDLMEEIKSKRFDEKYESAWSSNLDTDPGEDENDKSTFDDIDDFNGYSDSCDNQGVCEAGSSKPYQRSVTVNYVTLDASDIWQDCGATNCLNNTGDCTNCEHCCYKRIEVSVSHRFADSSLVTIVSGY